MKIEINFRVFTHNSPLLSILSYSVLLSTTTESFKFMRLFVGFFFKFLLYGNCVTSLRFGIRSKLSVP